MRLFCEMVGWFQCVVSCRAASGQRRCPGTPWREPQRSGDGRALLPRGVRSTTLPRHSVTGTSALRDGNMYKTRQCSRKDTR